MGPVTYGCHGNTFTGASAKLGLFLAAFLLVSSCGLSSRYAHERVQNNPEIFQVGELEVRLYQDGEKMARDLPPFFALLEATRVGDKEIRVRGYYDRENKRIYTIDDARTVIHEFKHYLEPGWRHEAETQPAATSHLAVSQNEDDFTLLMSDLMSDLSLE